MLDAHDLCSLPGPHRTETRLSCDSIFAAQGEDLGQVRGSEGVTKPLTACLSLWSANLTIMSVTKTAFSQSYHLILTFGLQT